LVLPAGKGVLAVDAMIVLNGEPSP
jgi:hypothetical protein